MSLERGERERGTGGRIGRNARKPKTPEGDTVSGASQRKADAIVAGKREEDVCFQEIQSLELRRARGREGGRERKEGQRFLVYRGINPYPQLPFVLGAAWSTC